MTETSTNAPNLPSEPIASDFKGSRAVTQGGQSAVSNIGSAGELSPATGPPNGRNTQHNTTPRSGPDHPAGFRV